MHLVSSVSTGKQTKAHPADWSAPMNTALVSNIMRTFKGASVQLISVFFLLFFLMPGNKTIVSEAKFITYCEIFVLKLKQHYFFKMTTKYKKKYITKFENTEEA